MDRFYFTTEAQRTPSKNSSITDKINHLDFSLWPLCLRGLFYSLLFVTGYAG